MTKEDKTVANEAAATEAVATEAVASTLATQPAHDGEGGNSVTAATSSGTPAPFPRINPPIASLLDYFYYLNKVRDMHRTRGVGLPPQWHAAFESVSKQYPECLRPLHDQTPTGSNP
ncbi:hypothetical protein Q8F55_007000 [Vanrija albida]|uniref:ARID domain-containing protein n=1 Tax=Vanrija albida TaxID=181172 RepID=A0ABR3PZ31_9TREE